MNRVGAFLISALFIIGLAALPHAAFAQETGSFFGPIIPTQCHCEDSAPGWGCVMQVIQNLMNFAISIAVLICVLIVAWAGALWLMSPFNPHNREMGRTVLLNAIIGLLITLSAWLIIDFVMKMLYNEGSFGPWNMILSENAESYCIQALPARPAPSGSTGSPASGSTGVTADPTADGTFSYQGNVSQQNGARSAALVAFLNCMANRVPGNVGQISAITDSYSGTDATRIAHCAEVGRQGDSQCSHTAHSCHYGGNSCVGESYAVDFGDEMNAGKLRAAAAACNPDARYQHEGDHVHISIGPSSNCVCDESMPKAAN